jgi:hypothetical protein
MSVVTTGEAETPTFPARCLTAYSRALPGVHDLVVTVARELSFAGLAPAQGRQDHTPSPYASMPLVARHESVHRIPLPTFVTTRTPLMRRRDGREIIINSEKRKIYFSSLKQNFCLTRQANQPPCAAASFLFARTTLRANSWEPAL